MKTKILSLFLAVVMLFSVLSVGATAESVTEVPEGYVGVYTKDDLFAVRENPSGKYILMNDIIFDDADYIEGGDFYNSGKGWEPIGTLTTPFKGIFDGNGYEIVNLHINNPSGDYQGLFGYTQNSTITNTNLIDAYIIGGNYTGGIVGFSYTGALSNCYVNGHISGKNYISGICGYGEYGLKISYCSFSGTVQGTLFVGGIAGYLNVVGNGGNRAAIYIEKSVNSGTINGENNIGGIVGYADSRYDYNYGTVHVYIKNCLNAGNICAINTASGISCKNKYTNIQNCLSVGDVTAEKANPVTNTETIKFSYYLDTSVNNYTGIYGTPKSPDQLKKQGTFEQWDFNTVWTMEGREDFPYPELRNVPLVFPDDSKTEISGTVTVKGEAKVGSTLTAEITGVSPEGATFEYEWKVDGKIVGTEATYTVTQEDVGKNITLTLKGNRDYKGSITSASVVAECVHSVVEYTNNNDATCDKNETKSGVCEKCNATVIEEIEDSMLPHTFINYIYDNNATCTADGTKTAKCENCNATDTITAENTKVEHVYDADVTEPTCNDDGEIIYTCSCGDTYRKKLYAAGHIDNDGDEYCDECSESLKNECPCVCHSEDSLISFFQRIIRFLRSLFGLNFCRQCKCDYV